MLRRVLRMAWCIFAFISLYINGLFKMRSHCMLSIFFHLAHSLLAETCMVKGNWPSLWPAYQLICGEAVIYKKWAQVLGNHFTIQVFVFWLFSLSSSAFSWNKGPNTVAREKCRQFLVSTIKLIRVVNPRQEYAGRTLSIFSGNDFQSVMNTQQYRVWRIWMWVR